MSELVPGLVSVIIPTYNRAHCLFESITSVLSQTYRDIEVLVIDDGSDDDTLDKMGSFTDPRVVYHRRNHEGACAARNYGMRMAVGEYIAFHDSDDIWLSRKIEEQVNYLRHTDYDICFCRMKCNRVGKKKRWLVPRETFSQIDVCLDELLKANFISTQTIIGKHEAIVSERFDPSFPRLQDWDYVIRLMQSNSIGFIDNTLVKQYIRSDSISQNPRNRAIALRMLLDKYSQLYEQYPDSKAAALCSLGKTLLSFDATEAVSVFRESYTIKPSLKTRFYMTLCSIGLRSQK